MPAVQFTANGTFVLAPGDPVVVDVLNERQLEPLIQLMPRGMVWDYSEDSILRRVCVGVARAYGRLDAYQRSVIRQLDPRTATFAIGNWEALLELDAGNLTLVERRLKVLTKLRARGGQSGPYFKALLESLGYTNVVITRLGNPFRCGDRLRKRLQGTDWRFAFKISADSIPALDDEMAAAVRDGLRASAVVHFELT